ncbi:34888_t:CDS:2 [Racocetra persica]|uniref:34888_t:CDS:1 n=1 Tax=Racocetra persica TaxID=160502 RepID=A0ACA9KC88_9GLOM|nr:34888_t:CDS:2 [Racocetra persica]
MEESSDDKFESKNEDVEEEYANDDEFAINNTYSTIDINMK